MAARQARQNILYDGCYAHVISRSIMKQELFKDQADFLLFRKLLVDVKKQSQFKIFHYCLMHTHFHLAVKIPEMTSFSKAIQRLKSLYIYRFHAKYKKSGPVWRERYRSLLIENESYLYACGQYIEQNPVKAKLVGDCLAWEHSSARFYLEGKQDELVDGYEGNQLPVLPKNVKEIDEGMFENGVGIGSGYFLFQLKERFKEGRTMPY